MKKIFSCDVWASSLNGHEICEQNVHRKIRAYCAKNGFEMRFQKMWMDSFSSDIDRSHRRKDTIKEYAALFLNLNEI